MNHICPNCGSRSVSIVDSFRGEAGEGRVRLVCENEACGLEWEDTEEQPARVEAVRYDVAKIGKRVVAVSRAIAQVRKLAPLAFDQLPEDRENATDLVRAISLLEQVRGRLDYRRRLALDASVRGSN
jgi:hypothetical protein